MYLFNDSPVPFIKMRNEPAIDVYHCGWEMTPVRKLPVGKKNGAGQRGGALHEHQRRTASAAMQQGRRGLLIHHSTGTGKTTITLSIAVQLLIQDPTLHVLIAGPAKGISTVWNSAVLSIPQGLQGEANITPGLYSQLSLWSEFI